ncbi:MAG: hypothetical protein IJ740_04705 [Ruminococcus sp.]|nr:hypothetical protein [Ruminococcus sp.]
MKMLLAVIAELFVIAALFFAGAWLDSLQSPAGGSKVNGHPAPVFIFLLPICGAVIMILINAIVMVKRSFGGKHKNDDKK